jgi:hypothetical protein
MVSDRYPKILLRRVLLQMVEMTASKSATTPNRAP